MSLQEIAKQLQVSCASVSIVRQGKPGVSQKTRRRIQIALEENGYGYREYALPEDTRRLFAEAPRDKRYIRLLKYYRSALLTDKNEGFVDAMINSVCEYAQTAGYMVVLNAVSHADYPAFVKELTDTACAGLLAIATEMDQREISTLSALSMPVVILDSDHTGLPFSTVSMDNRGLAYTAVMHLLSVGADEVGYLRSDIRTGNFIGRENGYREALRDFGLCWKDEIVYPLTPSLSGARDDMLAYLSKGRRVPRALFADNDVIAIGCMRALKQYHIEAPDDVYIAGVDNTMLSQIAVPSLTSMQISRSVIGQMAISALVNHLYNPNSEPVHIRVGAQLIARSSTNGRDKAASNGGAEA